MSTKNRAETSAETSAETGWLVVPDVGVTAVSNITVITHKQKEHIADILERECADFDWDL